MTGSQLATAVTSALTTAGYTASRVYADVTELSDLVAVEVHVALGDMEYDSPTRGAFRLLQTIKIGIIEKADWDGEAIDATVMDNHTDRIDAIVGVIHTIAGASLQSIQVAQVADGNNVQQSGALVSVLEMTYAI